MNPCHHGMGHPQVTDGEDFIHKRRAAVNKLNKHHRQPTRDGLPSCVLSEGLTSPHCKNLASY